MELKFQTYREVARYLQTSNGIIIPLGSMEQHGPIGLIATDSLCAHGIARTVGERENILVAPTLELGQAQFNLGFPGTICLRAETQIAMIRDVIDSLSRQGFKAFYFLNGHGGNIAPAQCAIQDWLRDTDSKNCERFMLKSWWQYPSVSALCKELFGRGEGIHATPSEISIVQYLYPESIHDEPVSAAEELSDEDRVIYRGDNHAGSVQHKKNFPDGLIGSNPGLARPQHGERLLEAAVSAAARDFQRFINRPDRTTL